MSGGWIAFGAALAGGLVTGLTSIWIMRAQLEHEDAVRFHEARRVIYSDFYGAASDCVSDVGAGRQKSLSCMERFASSYGQLLIVASDDVIEAANRVSACLEASDAECRALKDLLHAVRAELGIEPVGREEK